MNLKEFSDKIKNKLLKINLFLTDDMIEKLYKYMILLLEWNEKINLTAIVEANEVIDKHFIDSLTASKYLEAGNKVIDIGTGAGFPGIPLAIVNENVEFILADSLNKRINFLKIVIDELELRNVKLVHGRAEELGKNINFREKFDVSVSRAVANLNVLLEYTMPFVKIGGIIVCLKGSNAQDEIENAKKVIDILGGKMNNVESFVLPDTEYERNIIEIGKIKATPAKYPRKAGTPSKDPL